MNGSSRQSAWGKLARRKETELPQAPPTYRRFLDQDPLCAQSTAGVRLGSSVYRRSATHGFWSGRHRGIAQGSPTRQADDLVDARRPRWSLGTGPSRLSARLSSGSRAARWTSANRGVRPGCEWRFRWAAPWRPGGVAAMLSPPNAFGYGVRLVCVKVKQSMRALHLGWFILLIDLLFLGTPGFAQQDQPPSTPPEAPSSEPIASDSSVSKTTSLPDLTPDANGKLSQQQMRELTRVVAQNYTENYKKLRDYTYVDREVTHKLDGKGQIKSTETKTYEIMELYGESVARLIEKDDKPLAGKDAAKEEERIQKLADKRKNESEDEQRKQQAEKEKARQKGREFVSEVADAYNFRLVGSEMLNGRDTWVIDGEPRPKFHAQLREAQMLSKFPGRLWGSNA